MHTCRYFAIATMGVFAMSLWGQDQPAGYADRWVYVSRNLTGTTEFSVG